MDLKTLLTIFPYHLRMFAGLRDRNNFKRVSRSRPQSVLRVTSPWSIKVVTSIMQRFPIRAASH